MEHTIILVLLAFCSFPTAFAALMTDTSITFSSNKTNEDLEITVEFRPSSQQLSPGDKVYIHLPRFTRSTYVQGEEGGAAGSDLAAGDLELSPSIYWTGEYTEGTYCAGDCQTPFAASVITLELRNLEAISPNALHTVIIESSNGIKAYCGKSQDSADVLIGTDASGVMETQAVESSEAMGTGCHADCSGQGECDYCYNKCECDEGYGSPQDVTQFVSGDCSSRICPWGRASTVPLSSTKAHEKAECSNNGLCDRAKGECLCFRNWEGAACDRRRCPNDCSGHGMCASMSQQSQMAAALPLSTSSTANVYGSTDTAKDTVAWDYDAMRSCICDSDWTVGLGSGEVQEPQWFGPDCSLRRCPSGDNPDTTEDETDCSGKTAPGGKGVGEPGNVCYVECSNQGVCEYDINGIGSCRCFPGYLGDDCSTKSEFGGRDGIVEIANNSILDNSTSCA